MCTRANFYLLILPSDSGHGGQSTDASGKEADGKDESMYAFSLANWAVGLYTIYLLLVHSDISFGL